MPTTGLSIPFRSRLLDNGLRVIVHVDRHCPVAAVNVWYHVGSKDDPPGRSGLAHLFEHLMFKGSAHHDASYFEPLQQAGGVLNGSTNADRTNYWEVVPSNALELALWMESDRMGFLLPALTGARFAAERDVVLNERRQRYENRPYGLAPIAMAAALYPAGHPYCRATIGSPEDLCGATLDDARAFFSRFYHPANASLAIAGDVEADEAFDLADAHFGEIPRGNAPPVVPLAPPAASPSRLLLEDRVELPRLYLGWLSPAAYAAGDAELDLLAAALAGGKSSLLHRSLVYERRLATDVLAAQVSRERGGAFQVAATAAPGVPLDTLERAIDDELDRVRAAGLTGDELARALAGAESAFISRLQAVGGFGGKSDQLNHYSVMLGDPGFFERDLDRYRHACRSAIRRVAAAVLDPACRVTLSVVPAGARPLAARDSQPAAVS
ncbi:MAG TPA: pitrilysin family protein [Vicinamibacterales bacterium]|nr:pitrilysin family protein [Vicinamibacterales bacterium]